MIKKILIGLGIFILVLIIGIAVFLLTFDLNHYKEYTTKQLSTLLNKPVQIGSMSTKLALIPTIQVTDFKIINPQDKSDMISIPRIETTIELMPLLINKKINIQKISVDELKFNIDIPKNESNTNGANTQDDIESTDALTNLWIADINFQRINGVIKKDGSKFPLEIKDLKLSDLSQFEGSFIYNANDIKFQGNFGSILKLITNPTSIAGEIVLSYNNNEINLNGKIENLQKLSPIQCNITAQLDNPKALANLNNIELSDKFNMPMMLKISTTGSLNLLKIASLNLDVSNKDLSIEATGDLGKISTNPTLRLKYKANTQGRIGNAIQTKPMTLNGDINATLKDITFNNLKLEANKSDITGQIRLKLSTNPIEISTNLSSNYFEITDFVADKQNATNTEEAPAPELPQREEQHMTSPWDTLNHFDLTGQIQLNHLALWNQVNDYAVILIKPELRSGTLTAPIQIRLMAGTINSVIRLNASRQNAQIKIESGNLSLDRIQSINKDIQNGKIVINTSLESSGNTLTEIISNSNGQITLELLEGTIINKWFNTLPNILKSSAQRANTYSAAEATTKIICGVVNVPLENGIIKSRNQIALQTDSLNFVLDGQVDLSNKYLNMTMIPAWSGADSKTNNLLSLTQAIKIQGPWNNVQADISATKTMQSLVKAAFSAPQNNNPNYYCERALKRPMSKLESAPKATVATKAKAVVQEPVKEESLKQQLVDSLSQALIKKIK